MKLQKIAYSTIFSLAAFTGCTDISTKKEEEQKKVVKKVVEQKNVTNKPTISVSQKKQNFKDTLIPIVLEVYTELELQYQTIKSDIKSNQNRKVIDRLKKEYNVKSDKLLLQSLKPHPVSIVLAQAAAESAWLTSRFTKEANNIFGVWSFNKNEPRIAASGLRGDKTIYLKKYKTLKSAVRDYYKNLGKNWAYKEFRKNRTLTSNPYVLVDYLGSYSEKKELYTKLLRSMIQYNKFEQYDIKSDLDYNFVIEKKNNISIDTNTTSLENNQTILKDLNITKKSILKNKIEKTTVVDINTTVLDNNASIVNDFNNTIETQGLDK